MYCIYHKADLDGKCSAAIVKYKFPDCELIGMDYGEPIPELTNEVVYMVDFSLQPFEEMRKFASKNTLVWIDHHISVIKEFEKYGLSAFDVVLKDGTAACELTWDYLIDEPVPSIVHYLAEYDVWRLTDKVLAIQYGMRVEDTAPCNSTLWTAVFEDSFNELEHTVEQAGKAVLKYVEQGNKIYAQVGAFETELEGYKAIAINKLLGNSQLFESVWNPDKYDIMIAFGWQNGKWKLSFYTTKEDVDVSILAKKFGGGGHAKASGCQLVELPFELS